MKIIVGVSALGAALLTLAFGALRAPKQLEVIVETIDCIPGDFLSYGASSRSDRGFGVLTHLDGGYVLYEVAGTPLSCVKRCTSSDSVANRVAWNARDQDWVLVGDGASTCSTSIVESEFMIPQFNSFAAVGDDFILGDYEGNIWYATADDTRIVATVEIANVSQLIGPQEGIVLVEQKTQISGLSVAAGGDPAVSWTRSIACLDMALNSAGHLCVLSHGVLNEFVVTPQGMRPVGESIRLPKGEWRAISWTRDEASVLVISTDAICVLDPRSKRITATASIAAHPDYPIVCDEYGGAFLYVGTDGRSLTRATFSQDPPSQ